MYKISIDKNLFKDIQFKKITLLEKATSLYWKKELLEPIIENDKIRYRIKQLDKILLTNGLGEDKPQMTVECLKIDYSFKKDIFEFYLGRILEQKNTDTEHNYKDSLIEQLLREKAQLEDNINKDHLTNVFNRRKMENDLNMYINQKNSDLLCSVFIDADRFKRINDTYGHDVGDKVLQYIAKKLDKHAKLLNGEVYRYGGEEFVIFCFMNKFDLLNKIDNLRLDIKSQKIYNEKGDITVSVSIGVSFYKECKNKEEMLKLADDRVYKAKINGRDRIEYN